MIKDVLITPLRVIADERGWVKSMLSSAEAHFVGFGEIYFSSVNPGQIKAWKRHHRMTLNLACPQGDALVVLYDDRPASPSQGMIQEIRIGSDHRLVTVPPMIWSGFTAVNGRPALLANCASIPHDPSEADRLDPSDPAIPYVWAI